MVSAYNKYKVRNFTILAFPCNQYDHQEPGSNEDIKKFVAGYNVTFPMFSKVNVTNETDQPGVIFPGVIDPVYQYMLSCFPGYIPWNFEAKFIFDMNGIPLTRFTPAQNFTEVETFIVKMLDARDNQTKLQNQRRTQALR